MASLNPGYRRAGVMRGEGARRLMAGHPSDREDLLDRVQEAIRRCLREQDEIAARQEDVAAWPSVEGSA
jgi:hypothetical protein